MGVKDIWSKGALAEELDALSLEMAGVSDKIGQSDDTGGTTAAGTVFGKLNKLIGDFAGHISNWTAARAAKIDNLDVKSSTISSKVDDTLSAVGYVHTLKSTLVETPAQLTKNTVFNLIDLPKIMISPSDFRSVSNYPYIQVSVRFPTYSSGALHLNVELTSGGETIYGYIIINSAADKHETYKIPILCALEGFKISVYATTNTLVPAADDVTITCEMPTGLYYNLK